MADEAEQATKSGVIAGGPSARSALPLGSPINQKSPDDSAPTTDVLTGISGPLRSSLTPYTNGVVGLRGGLSATSLY